MKLKITAVLFLTAISIRADSVKFFGDSITCGVGASDQAHSYAYLVSAGAGWSSYNYCINGRLLADMMPTLYYTPLTTLATDKTVALLGYNDMRLNGNSAAALVTFGNTLGSFIGYSGIPTSQIVKAQSGSVSYTGTWANTTAWPSIGKYSGTNGSTASFYVTGTTVYIDLIQFNGLTRGMKIQIDGINYGVMNAPYFPTTYWGLPYSPALVRIPNLSPGTHAVTLTVTDGSGYAYFNWAAGVFPHDRSTKPAVYIGNTLRMPSNGYTVSTAAPFTNGSDMIVRQFNDEILSVCRQMYADGLNVHYVDQSSRLDTSTDYAADDIHPNNSGHAKIAATFLAAISAGEFIY